MSDFDRNKCFKTMNKLVNKIEDRITGTLWHYTTAEGFKGIIESNEIWMTNALFVNDKTELRASFENDDIFKDIQFKNTDFNVFKSESREVDVDDCYLASFSKKDDSLGQFRSYGNYCIGFDPKKLKNNKSSLYKCVYKIADIKKWIISRDKLKEWQNECFDNEEGQYYKISAFYDVLFARRAKFKDKHYESEKEIRLLVVSNSSWGVSSQSPTLFCEQPSIYFRDHDLFNVPVPYVKFLIPNPA